MKYSHAVAVAALLLLSVTAVFAQTETGAISGTVKDASGAVVAGAQVTATSLGTSASRTATTDSTGVYNITNLAPALYELKVSSEGFGDYRQKFAVNPGGHSTVDALLSAKGTETLVEVTAQQQTEVDTQTSSINQLVSSNQVSQLPSLTRNPYDFVQTMGNVNQDSSSGTGGLNQVTRGAGVSIMRTIPSSWCWAALNSIPRQ